jgi:hypothetical protein
MEFFCVAAFTPKQSWPLRQIVPCWGFSVKGLASLLELALYEKTLFCNIIIFASLRDGNWTQDFLFVSLFLSWCINDSYHYVHYTVSPGVFHNKKFLEHTNKN